MTKTIAFSLVVAASFGLAACSQQEANNTVNDSYEMTDDVSNAADDTLNSAGNALDDLANGVGNLANNAM